jgi:transcription initiation factor TFIIB
MTTTLSTPTRPDRDGLSDDCDDRTGFEEFDTGDDCPECAGPTATVRGETACTDCGLVLAEDVLDRGPEWRAFNAGETRARSRVGAATTPTMFDWGVSSQIGWGGDAHGNPLSSSKRRRIARMRTQNRRAVAASKRERNLIRALEELARLVSVLELSMSIHEEASVLYRRAYEENLLRGRTIDGIVAGAVYATCRLRGVLRTIAEIAVVSPVTEHDVRVSYGVLNVELGLAVLPVSPHLYLSRLTSAFDAPPAVRERARDLVTLAVASGVATGKNPASVAGATLYLAGVEQLRGYRQIDIAEAAGVTPVTLRQRYYDLKQCCAETDS